ncbi:hypothetical protein HanRHA438_Chr17g0790301 [Helianthus annuus]|uniref:Uncharacterized protein n=1 Tax=Helianthus annuus TaxID=4232 RepID=A0A251RKU9_HELAN|nr:hypothetical protein HanXRQr2_Chr17g0779671 [Helianthus annuus]KAJ0427487.1 hypothetical protein HanHA300_Chr17g0635821 [Helianthus annuus]KAJ0445768.1 hypothetical protein HanHA89_Chr17g0687091 [Helianthus annuus]KAJ0630735.1 hypothetical protein HanLR1_Chr17g0646511 [Helianthus annuus]KAJ0634592.1 hypothetical protein HanOQP8_Chr17g0641761 [Helianthus annuus]
MKKQENNIYSLLSFSSLNTFWFFSNNQTLSSSVPHMFHFKVEEQKESRLSSSVINSGEQPPTHFSVPSILWHKRLRSGFKSTCEVAALKRFRSSFILLDSDRPVDLDPVSP